MSPLAKAAEITAISTSVIGAIASVITQQVVYSAAPMSIALFLNAFNRFRLEQKFRQDQRTVLEQVDVLITGASTDVETKVEKIIEDRFDSFLSAFANSESTDTQLLFGRKAS